MTSNNNDLFSFKSDEELADTKPNKTYKQTLMVSQ
jgi:hypothetical protein